jgi:hypothetical protein
VAAVAAEVAGALGMAGAARAWLWATVVLTLGALAAAVLLAPPASAAPSRGLVWLLFVSSSVHVASTGWVYTLPEVRAHAAGHRARYIWVPAALILAAAAVAAALSPAVLRWGLLPYFGWQFFHYQKQNMGLAALTASASGVPSPRPAERRALLTAGCAGIAGLVAHPGLLQLRIDPGLRFLYPAAAALFAAAVLAGLAALARRPAASRPRGYCLVYLVCLLFSLPVFVFSSPYAAVGGMTMAHGLQYLLLLGLLAGGERTGTGRMLRLAVFCNIALGGGAALSAASHLHGAASAGRLLFGAYLGVVMAHFVVDAGLWRLRDPFPRFFLESRLPYLVPSGRRPGGSTAGDGSPDDVA